MKKTELDELAMDENKQEQSLSCFQMTLGIKHFKTGCGLSVVLAQHRTSIVKLWAVVGCG